MASYKRYKGIKGDFWTVFSQYIRLRDWVFYGTCISCGSHLESWKYADCGHFIAAGHCGFDLLFDEKNNNLQCKHCNNPMWSPDSGAFYAEGLDRRYGKGTANRLITRYRAHKDRGVVTKEWTKQEYEKKIKLYQRRINTLCKKYGIVIS